MGVLSNVTNISLFKSPTEYIITNVKEVSHKDDNPYVNINIPYGPLLYQQILPSTIFLKALCLNYQSLITALTDSGAYNFTTMKRTEMDYLLVYTKTDTGTEKKYKFEYPHIETLAIDKLTERIGETVFIVTFRCKNGPIEV